MPETGLSAENLECARGGYPVFSGIGFSLTAGEALVVTGPNGAGKSSLLMAIAGLVPLTGGTLTHTGADPEAARGSHMHFLGHRPGIKAGLSVRENLAFWCAVLGGESTTLDAALEAAGLGRLGDFDAGVLSAGQTRRLALARVLAAPRPLWLLDEPTAALDRQGADWVGGMLTHHLETGGVAVIATHAPLGIEDRAGAHTLEMTRPVMEPAPL